MLKLHPKFLAFILFLPACAPTSIPADLPFPRDLLQRVHEQTTGPSVLAVISRYRNPQCTTFTTEWILTGGQTGSRTYSSRSISGGGPNNSTPTNPTMPATQRRTLDALLASLPPSQPCPNDHDLLLVSWNNQNIWTTRTYNQSQLPLQVLALCEFMTPPSNGFGFPPSTGPAI